MMDPQVSGWAGSQESSSSNIKFHRPEHYHPKDLKVTFGCILSVSHNVPETDASVFVWYLSPFVSPDSEPPETQEVAMPVPIS